MFVKSWIGLALAGVALASPSVAQVYGRDINAAQDVPAVRAGLSSMTAALNDFDASVKKVTAANAADSLKELNTKAHNLGTALEKTAASISASAPLKGIQDAIGLLTQGRATITAVNQTYQDLSAKLDIIKNSKQTALVVDALKAQKAGIIALPKAIDSQIPASLKSQIPAGILPADQQVSAVLDDLITQVGAIMDGKAASFSLPAGLPPLPTGAAGGMAGMPGMGAPKSGGAAKGSAKGPYVGEMFKA